ncbi:MAG TPA: biotin--[acetyl-CoA-carboxylase] ligase [Chthoniobacterales bacterium]|jgi:BirA family biotin operon repressor/biotin-[acetyl-CoA-carboxylase] ligase|nr:biotin--[acetyl-CoA-carboxylase] ligase [Chthoniobacterales bacterium]
MSRLEADALRRALGECTIGREIIALEETTSTNDAVLQMATPNTREGLVLFAEHQSAGRGQRNNRWESAAHKGLWFSILLRPMIDISKSARLTAWAAEIVAKTILQELALAATIKLPNDVCVEGKKVAGMLVEMRAQEKASHLAIAGIGINVNQTLEDFSEALRPRAVSLAMALDRHVNRQEFAVALLRNLDRTYREIFASYEGRSSSLLSDVKNQAAKPH